MVLFSKFITRCHVKRSSSPCRSPPTSLPNPSAENICSRLSQIVEISEFKVDLFPDLISGNQNKKWVEELLDKSMKLLEVCSRTWDMVTQFKEQIRDVNCLLRRRKFDLRCETGIKKYNCFRKKMKKDAKLLIAGLKQADNMITSDASMAVDSDNNQLATVIKVVSKTVPVFESLLMYFGMPISKPSRWSILVSKLIHKGKGACEDQQEHGIMNDFEIIDLELQNLCKNGSSEQEKKMQIAKCRLERKAPQIECLETGLECMFRHLIRIRASLLNIISQ
ncbi:hypothetical protein R6Q59_013835 [Mikania micrantha]